MHILPGILATSCLILLAGCTDAPLAPDGGVEPAQAALEWRHEQRTTMASWTSAGVCVPSGPQLEREQFEVWEAQVGDGQARNVTLRLTWDHLTPDHETVRMVVVDEAQQTILRVVGTSPLDARIDVMAAGAVMPLAVTVHSAPCQVTGAGGVTVAHEMEFALQVGLQAETTAL